MPLDADPPTDLPDDLPEGDRLFDIFRAARGSQEMLALAAATPGDALDALEGAVEARLAQAEGERSGRVARAAGEPAFHAHGTGRGHPPDARPGASTRGDAGR